MRLASLAVGHEATDRGGPYLFDNIAGPSPLPLPASEMVNIQLPLGGFPSSGLLTRAYFISVALREFGAWHSLRFVTFSAVGM